MSMMSRKLFPPFAGGSLRTSPVRKDRSVDRLKRAVTAGQKTMGLHGQAAPKEEQLEKHQGRAEAAVKVEGEEFARGGKPVRQKTKGAPHEVESRRRKKTRLQCGRLLPN